MSKIAWVTGASSGIGKATAVELASQGFNLILSARRSERLIDLENQLIKDFGINVLSLKLDVRNRNAVLEACNSLDSSWNKIDVLVNNAGLASGMDLFQDASLDDWDQMIDTNVKGLLYVSKGVVPFMIDRAKGHIINIDSTAGKEVYPKGNVYCATKYAVDAISKGMRIDLLEHNIKVTNICPGMVDTEFSKVRFHGDEAKANQVYNGFKPLVAEDIASCIGFAVGLPEHVCINDLVVTCTAQANSMFTKRD